jgi:hypothetical protein
MRGGETIGFHATQSLGHSATTQTTSGIIVNYPTDSGLWFDQGKQVPTVYRIVTQHALYTGAVFVYKQTSPLNLNSTEL